MVFGSKSRRSSLFKKSRAQSRNTSSSSRPILQQNTEWVSSDDDVPATQGVASGSRDALIKTLKGWKSTRAGLLGKGDQETRNAIQHLIGSTSSEEVSHSHEQARSETNHGLKRAAGKGAVVGKRQSSVSKGKGKGTDKHTFRVGTVILLPGGVVDRDEGNDQGSDTEPLLRLPEDNSRVPDKLKLLLLKQQGLALVDRENGIPFEADESWVAVDRRLRGYFPAVWDHFDNLEYGPEANHSDEFQSRWLVCMRIQRRVHVMPNVDFPEGADLDESSRVNRSGFKERTLLLTTRDPIPQSLIRQWAPGQWSQTKTETALNTAASSSTIPSVTVTLSLKRKASALSVTSNSSGADQESGPPRKYHTRSRSAAVVSASNSTVAVATAVDAEAELATDLGSDHDDDDMADATWHSNPTPPATRSPLLLAEMSSFTIDDSIPNPWGTTALDLGF
ncbi:hypothetical protein EYR40_002568 [Pleurotus pulmonarius]|nr:hypothetical protein EYR40_002568 [Pleurotus pulmonarius]